MSNNKDERFLRFKDDGGERVYIPLFQCGFETVSIKRLAGYAQTQFGWRPAMSDEVGQEVARANIFNASGSDAYVTIYGPAAEEFQAWLDARSVGFFGGRE